MADDLSVDVSDFRRLFDRSSQVEKQLKTQLRKNIREAGNVAANAVKAEIGSGTLRSRIAAGIQVKIMTGNRAGVTIVASSRAMGPGQESLVRAWEKEQGFRHPVFGRAVYVTQMGHPYFRKPITDHRDAVRAAVEQAMETAAQSLGALT